MTAQRFGLQLPNFSLGVPDDALFEKVVEFATAAEDSGFSSVWVMDHFYQLPALGGGDQPMLEAYTLLGALAARTTKAQLGTLVTGVTYRNPAMLAKIITTLDVISKGRAILGIGAAWHDIEHEGMGFAFPAVKERMDRLEEAVQICRAMFRADHASFEGTHYAIRDVRNLPRPIQPGGPKIMIGGGGEKRTLKLVAKYADQCNVTGDADMIRHKIKVIHDHCATVGRDPSEIEITRMATLFLTESDEQTAQIKEFLVNAAGEDALAGANVGQEQEIVDQIAAVFEAGVDEAIFNMPLSPVDDVRRVGAFLAKSFS
jgi:F420-dependent oxidoreductase-like protein